MPFWGCAFGDAVLAMRFRGCGFGDAGGALNVEQLCGGLTTSNRHNLCQKVMPLAVCEFPTVVALKSVTFSMHSHLRM
jgi:hypothetical protein